MNGGKLGATKKSNAHLNITNNGTLGGSIHGYGPITTILNSKSNASSVTNNMQQYNNMNINQFKNQSKDHVAALSKINGKLKKKTIGNNLTGLQSSCNTNPGREKALNEKANYERELSVEPGTNYNAGTKQNQMQRGRDNSEGGHRESSYLGN